MPRRDHPSHYQPTAGELEGFHNLLIDNSFNEADYHIHSLQVCAGWLGSRQQDVSMWRRNFQLNRNKLYETLLEIQTSLVGLCEMMDRLSGKRPSFFANSPFEKLNKITALHNEFLAFYNSLFDTLELYLNYANHLAASNDRREIVDISTIPAKPGELRVQFDQGLGDIELVLGKMAAAVTALMADEADLANPGAGPASVPS